MQYYSYLRRKYGNHLNYCFAEYEITRPGHIILNDSNPTYRKLFQIATKKYKRKKLTDLMRSDLAQHIAQRLLHFIESQKNHCFGWLAIHPDIPDLWENSLTIRYTRDSVRIYEIFRRMLDPPQNAPAPYPAMPYKPRYTLYCGDKDILLMLSVLPERIVIENTNCKQLFGLPFSKIIGKSIDNFSVLTSMKNDILECVESQNIVNCQKPVELNHDERHQILSFTPLFQGGSVRVLVYAQDITDSIIFHQQVHDLNEELNLCFENSSEAFCIYLVNEDKQMILERENLPYIKLREEFKQLSHPFLPKDVLRGVAESRESYAQNLCLRQANNEIRYFQLCLTPIFQNEKVHKIFACIKAAAEGSPPIHAPLPIFTLTNREQEILRLLLDGCTNKFISFKLSISEGTVKKFIYNIYKKLNVSSRVELIKLLLK